MYAVVTLQQLAHIVHSLVTTRAPGCDVVTRVTELERRRDPTRSHRRHRRSRALPEPYSTDTADTDADAELALCLAAARLVATGESCSHLQQALPVDAGAALTLRALHTLCPDVPWCRDDVSDALQSAGAVSCGGAGGRGLPPWTPTLPVVLWVEEVMARMHSAARLQEQRRTAGGHGATATLEDPVDRAHCRHHRDDSAVSAADGHVRGRASMAM